MAIIKSPEDNNNNVFHPKHYTGCSLECIQVMRLMFGRTAVMWFCFCNAFKYMWRFKLKNGNEDLRKAENYITLAIDNGIEKPEYGKILDNLSGMLVELMKQEGIYNE